MAKNGTEAKVTRLPNCDFDHPDVKVIAEYDFKTKEGPWANGCRKHYLANRCFVDLGIGKAQRLVLISDTKKKVSKKT